MIRFMTAEWRDLAMLNWEVPPEALCRHVPLGTELDTFNGRTYVSLVGFRWARTRLLKAAIPFHTAFEEVNLRFYVKRIVDDEVRRGVVFIKEIVPRACVALVARRVYNENFVTASMSHQIDVRDGRARVAYRWRLQGTANSLRIRASGPLQEMPPDALETFIAEHYWGYSRQRDGGTVEYRVDHPRWRIAAADECSLTCDFEALYGQAFGPLLASPPDSVFLADGSPIEVGFGQRLSVERPASPRRRPTRALNA